MNNSNKLSRYLHLSLDGGYSDETGIEYGPIIRDLILALIEERQVSRSESLEQVLKALNITVGDYQKLIN